MKRTILILVGLLSLCFLFTGLFFMDRDDPEFTKYYKEKCKYKKTGKRKHCDKCKWFGYCFSRSH